MKQSRRSVALGKMLDLCDELQRIRHCMSEPGLRREERTRLRRQSKRKSDQLSRNLSTYRFRGPLGQVMRSFRFTPVDFEILSLLLHRAMRSEEPEIEGRVILGSIFETSYGVLTGLHLLQENAPLRASGLVALADDEEDGEDLLEARFRLSEETVEAFRAEVGGALPADQRQRKIEAYRNHRELLVELRILHNLHLQRSRSVFRPDRWDRLYDSSTVPGRGLSRRIDRLLHRIHRRLALTADPQNLPAVRLMRDYQLDDQELVMIVHLFFRELYEGNAYADAVDLLRLVSADEDQLIKNRRLVLPGASLIRHEILKIEPLLEGRELTGEAHLSDWVVNYLFGVDQIEEVIQPDERLEWHLYLKNLEDTGSFYNDLESN